MLSTGLLNYSEQLQLGGMLTGFGVIGLFVGLTGARWPSSARGDCGTLSITLTLVSGLVLLEGLHLLSATLHG